MPIGFSVSVFVLLCLIRLLLVGFFRLRRLLEALLLWDALPHAAPAERAGE